MKPNESNQDLIATHCCRTGRQCHAALNLARKLSSAGKLACSTQPDFEMTGESRLDGCPLSCIARFALSQQGVELYCGAEPDDDLDDLATFANGFVDGGDSMPPSGDLTRPPLAFVLVPADAPRVSSQSHGTH